MKEKKNLMKTFAALAATDLTQKESNRANKMHRKEWKKTIKTMPLLMTLLRQITHYFLLAQKHFVGKVALLNIALKHGVLLSNSCKFFQPLI